MEAAHEGPTTREPRLGFVRFLLGAVMVVLAAKLVLVGIAVRVGPFWDDAHTPLLVLVISVVAAVLTFVGGTIGGTLVFGYGFNVETAGDSPVWHKSEHDVLPGDKAPPATSSEQASPATPHGP